MKEKNSLLMLTVLVNYYLDMKLGMYSDMSQGRMSRPRRRQAVRCNRKYCIA